MLIGMNQLTQKQEAVLCTIIREHIKTAKPVSSKLLTEGGFFKSSSATMRNIMASLEEDGYLTHPHTSAGRIPTAQGYRFYVNMVSERLSLGLTQRRYIIDFFATPLQLEELLKQTSRFIAEITSYLGIVIRYFKRKLGIKHIDLVPLKSGQLLLVIITKTGEIFEERIVVSKYDFELQKIEQIFNKELVGLDLIQVVQRCEHLKNLRLFGQLFDEIANQLVQLLEKKQIDLYYDGITNLLNFPEFAGLNMFSNVLALLEDGHSTLGQISEGLKPDYTFVAIGNELGLPVENASLVVTPYFDNEQLAGAVGLIGPMRMDYEKAMATTECIAGNLTSTLQNMA